MHIAQEEFHLDAVDQSESDEPVTRVMKLRYAIMDSLPLPLVMMGFSCRLRRGDGKEVRTRPDYSFKTLLFVVHKNAGLLLLIMMVLGLVRFHGLQDVATRDYLDNPQVNDFWFVDHRQFDPSILKGFQYTTYQVIAVNRDWVEVKVGNIYHDKPVSARRHVQYDQVMQRQFFSGRTQRIPRSELAALAQSNGIYSVRRPENMTIDGWIVLKRSNEYTNPK